MNNIVKRINDSTAKDFFPTEFSNEVYYSSSLGSFGPIDYTSNLTIKYVERGCDYYKVGGHEHKLLTGQYLIINSGNEVSSYSNTTTITEGMSIFMDPAIMSEVSRSKEDPESQFTQDSKPAFHLIELPHHLDNDLGIYLKGLFQSIRRADATTEITNGDLFYYQLAELMYDSQVEMQNKLQRIPRVKKSVKLEIYKKAALAKDYLDNNFKETIRLDHLSRVAGLSKYYLIKCFQMIYGHTPYEFVINLRIENAKSELRRQNISITNISTDNGFSDLSSFSKKFKNVVGLSPREYRRQTIEKNVAIPVCVKMQT